MTQEALEAKREQLEELDKAEREARRLEDALSYGRPSNLRTSLPPEAEGSSEQPGDENEARRQEEESQSAYLPPHPGPNPVKRRAPGMGLLSALSYTLHGMMDVDPETARRNSITKTRETISQVSTSHLELYLVFIEVRVVGGRAASGSARPEVLELNDSGGLGSIPTPEGC